MTKKARDTKTPPAEAGALAEAAVTTPGLGAKSATEPAEVKNQLERSLMDWALFSLGLIGPGATKALLYDLAKRIHVPGGGPKKPFIMEQFVKALGRSGQNSPKAVREDGFAEHNIQKERKARQRETNKANKIALALVGRWRMAAIELGYITNEAGLSELGDVLEDRVRGAAVFERASQRQDKYPSDQ